MARQGDGVAVRYLRGVWGVEFSHRDQVGYVIPPPPSSIPPLLLLLLGGLLLGGGGLGSLGGLWLGGGLGRGQRLLGGLLGGSLLLGVGGQGGRAAGDVDVLAVVGHVLQGELWAVAGAQTHGAGSQRGRRLTHFWGEEGQSGEGAREERGGGTR